MRWPWSKPVPTRYEREVEAYAAAMDAADKPLLDAADKITGGPKPRGEAAPLKDDLRNLGAERIGALTGIDHNLSTRRAKDQANYGYFLGAYEEMLDWDAHLNSVFHQYVSAYLALPAALQPASDDAVALEICAFVQAFLDGLRGWRAAREAAVKARYYGFTPLEVVWPESAQPVPLAYEAPLPPQPGQRPATSARSRSAYLPVALAPRHPRRFLFDVVTAGIGPSASGLRLLSLANVFPGDPVAPLRFLVARPQSRFGDPNGVPLARTAWPWVRQKLDIAKQAMALLTRLGNPTAIYKRESGLTPGTPEYDGASKLVTSIIGGAGVHIDRDNDIVPFQATVGDGANAFAQQMEYCDAQESKLFLYQTLTTQQGDTGARAMASVHWDVRQDLLRDTAAAEAELWQELVDWLVEVNFGKDMLPLAPRWEVELDPPADDLQRAQVLDLAMNKLQADLSATQVRHDLKLEVPVDEADTLQPAPPPDPFGLGIGPGAEGQGPGTKNEPGSGGPGDKSKGSAAKAAATGQTAAAQHPGEVVLQLEAIRDGVSGPIIEFAPLAAAEGQRSAEALPTPELRRLLADGVAALSADDMLGALPGLVREQFSTAARAAYGDNWADEPLDLRLHGWERKLSFSDELRARVVNRLNDDLTIAQLYGRGKVIRGSKATAAGAAMFNGGTRGLFGKSFRSEQQSARQAFGSAQGLAAAAQDNPAADAIFDLPRLLPARVLEVLDKRIGNAMTYEEFYQLDALSRSAAFTAWDLAFDDVAHIGMALTDAAQTGMTAQQFADYLYDRLQARYVTQGSALHAWHVETIYHTNIAKMYNDAQRDEGWAEREAFPYQQFLNPSPQYPVCVEMAGKVWRTDDPVWREFSPPLHFNCGSYIAMLIPETVERRALTVSSARPVNQPLEYAGPTHPVTGQPVGTAQPFGAWAPLEERFAHLQAQRRAA